MNKLPIRRNWLDKNWGKSTIDLKVFYAKNKKIYPAYISNKKRLKAQKTSYYFNDSKRRKTGLPCSGKISLFYGFYSFSCLNSLRLKNNLKKL